MSVMEKPKFLSRAHEVSIMSARKPKSSPFSTSKSIKDKEAVILPKKQKTFCYTNNSFVAKNQVTPLNLQAFSRELKSDHNTWIEINELKKKIGSLKSFESNIENEPLITFERQDTFSPYEVNNISSRLCDPRKSSKRNFGRDTQNFLPLNNNSLSKRMDGFHSNRKRNLSNTHQIYPESLKNENLVSLVPEISHDSYKDQPKEKKVHHQARSSIIFKKPTNQDLDFSEGTDVEVAQRTFQDTSKSGVEKKLENTYLHARKHLRRNQNRLQRKIVNDSITSMEKTDRKDDSLSDCSTGRVNKMKTQAPTFFNSEVQSCDELKSNISDCSKTITEPEHVRVKVSHLRSAKVSRTVCKCICGQIENKVKKLETCGEYCKNSSSSQQFQAIFGSKNKLMPDDSSSKDSYIVASSWWRKWCDFINIEYNTFEELMKQTTAHKVSSEMFKFDNNTSVCVSGNFQSYYADSLYMSNLYGTKSGAQNNELEESHNVQQIAGRSYQTSENGTIFLKSDSDDHVYSKPGKIINKDLVRIYHSLESNEEIASLKANMQEGYDYIKVNKRCWDLLKSWYEFDFEVIAPNFDSGSCLSCL
ncbi:unnamed protein product [Moneuplotes crassus]|uniref:DUSP domain-containing protein n=1 Tax=Euplotes crassus TaxID=5936 RepID=A0AAD1U4G7_EUPCR|nr:unnamed protein product [Moneuplotes crassus]